MATPTTETAEEIRDQFAEAVRREAGKRTDRTRRQLGDVVVDATERYFPEAIRRRRRRDVASGFMLGVIVGFLLRYVVGER